MKRTVNRTVLILCSIVIILLFTPFLLQALTARQIAQKAFPAVVLLVMEDSYGQPISLGSGFFVRENVIATNLHVIEGAMKGYAKLIEQKTKYDIVGTVTIDTKRDLALLSVKRSSAPSLPIDVSSPVSVGDEVYVIGNPQGLEGTFSKGIISSIRQVGSSTILQITAPISPGSSGGPVLNTQGKVIGVAVATFQGGQNLNFAIPVSYLTSLLENIGPVTALSAKTLPKRDKSILNALGERSAESVVGEQLMWSWKWHGPLAGEYSFSLRNRLREKVKDVYCLVVFYNSAGNPIDVDLVRFNGIIPGGLARRVTSKVHQSVQEITSPNNSQYPTTQKQIEFRVLDFRIME